MKIFETFQGKQRGDPAKAALRIFEIVVGQGMAGDLKGNVLRLPLGPDCVQRFELKVKNMSDDLATSRDVCMSTDIVE